MKANNTKVAKTKRDKDQMVAVQYEGPLPPAGQLQQYEDVLPGAAERIFDMAEKEQRHTHSMQRASFQMSMLGTIFAWIMMAVVVLFGALLIWHGRNITGFVLLIGEAVAIIGARRAMSGSKRRKTRRKK